MDSKLAHGHVSKLLHEVAIDLGLNLIVKISLMIYFTLRIGRSNPPQVFTLKQLVSSFFMCYHIVVLFIFRYFA